MTTPDWRDGLWRYTAEVGNTMMVIWMGNAAFKALAATNSYLSQSDAKIKSVTNKSSSEAMADSLRKALESCDKYLDLGERSANFTLSTQWTPRGYICCGNRKRVSFIEGSVYNSRITLRIKYNVFQYAGTLEGKKDKKDKEKDDIGIRLDEPEKVAYNETILQNASIVQGDGMPPQLGYGVGLDITTEIGAGHDGRLYYEFRIYWKESCLTATFNDVISIKCYADGDVVPSGNFYDACDTAADVLQALSAGGAKSQQFTEHAEFLRTERVRAQKANAERRSKQEDGLRRRNPQRLIVDDDDKGERKPLIPQRDQYITIEEGSSTDSIIVKKDSNKTI